MDGGTVATRRSGRLPPRGGAEGGAPDATATAAAAAAAITRGFPALSEVLLKPLDPSNIHVLVVGDLGSDESSGEPVVDVLRASYRVTHASGDVDALALLRGVMTPPVDLILKEHEPPTTDGVKFIQRVLKNAALRHIPIVGARRERSAPAQRRRVRAPALTGPRAQLFPHAMTRCKSPTACTAARRTIWSSRCGATSWARCGHPCGAVGCVPRAPASRNGG
jgi:CheY-like chemotaxis protein